MQEILTAQAAEGMVLARDVMTPDGRVLCGKGTALSDNLIERLKKMEISHVLVEGRPVAVEGEKSLADELLDIDRRFRKVEDTPPLMYLKKKVKEKMIASRRG
ncbi:MAG: hypothetical protein KKG47_09740 [Proteobacteria bacterium]|nr:hypothetical protein [Pseudomonadota bacterium]MBU1736555.1 hypothetical protein [Pseudomonadota bacterium]